MIKHGHLISRVDPGSIAEELELEPGDMLLTIDGDEIEDIFDYEYRIDNEAITMVVRKKNGEESGWSLLWQMYKCKIIVILRQGGEAPNAGSLRQGGINGSEQYCGFRKRILPGD